MKRENRNFTRVPFRSEALLKSRDTQMRAVVENLSLNGALLKTAETLEVGREVEIEIGLVPPASDVGIQLVGKVARQTADGMAVQFTGMYLDAFQQLEKMLSTALGDRKKIIEEFLEYMAV